ncbi:hypothetical protein, partial [Roseiconus lacunae]|uniref:hypothetical protein n=1 Tax=Roseiconus lacunae TaxID=2605694 RepID=UPI001F1A7AD4
RVAELHLLKWLIFRGDRVIANVRRATSRSLVHSPSNADQIRRLSLWLDLGPSRRNATFVSWGSLLMSRVDRSSCPNGIWLGDSRRKSLSSYRMTHVVAHRLTTEQ